MAQFGSIVERLNGNLYYLDEQESHIEVNQDLAKKTGEGKLLVHICPAHVYSEEADGSVGVSYAACLECGTCLAITSKGVLKWHYPKGGCGVSFREG